MPKDIIAEARVWHRRIRESVDPVLHHHQAGLIELRRRYHKKTIARQSEGGRNSLKSCAKLSIGRGKGALITATFTFARVHGREQREESARHYGDGAGVSAAR